MNKEEKDAINNLRLYSTNVGFSKYDGTTCILRAKDVQIVLNLIGKQYAELNNLKEIEQLHKEENGKLRIEFEKVYEDNLTLAKELEQEKNKINAIKKLMAIGDVTDEALFTLVQTTMAELERLEDIEEQLAQEKEKNKELERYKKYYENEKIVWNRNDYISKDKIKEKIQECKEQFNCFLEKGENYNMHIYHIKRKAYEDLLESDT